MAAHNDLGIKGEKIAAEYLQKKGYSIECINWRNLRAEADIIAAKDDILVIVEVKTRSTDFFGSPAEAVGKQKQTMMVRAAEAYLQEKNIDKEVRYDVVSIIITQDKEIIEHIEEAFYPFSNQFGE